MEMVVTTGAEDVQSSSQIVKVEVKVHTLDIAPLRSESPPQKRSSPTNQHSCLLAGCPSRRPTNSVRVSKHSCTWLWFVLKCVLGTVCVCVLRCLIISDACSRSLLCKKRPRNCRCFGIGWHASLSLLSRAGSGVVRIDPLHFLAGCRTRRLNQV